MFVSFIQSRSFRVPRKLVIFELKQKRNKSDTSEGSYETIEKLFKYTQIQKYVKNWRKANLIINAYINSCKSNDSLFIILPP